MKHKTFYLIFTLFLFMSNLNAQSIYIYFNDGTSLTFPLNEVNKIDFSEIDMQLYKTDGSTFSWQTSSIKKYTYQDISISIEQAKVQDINVLIYPNPATSQINIQYYLSKPTKVDISLFSIKGKLITNILSEEQGKGEQTIEWKNNILESGTYFIKIKEGENIKTKKLIILK